MDDQHSKAAFGLVAGGRDAPQLSWAERSRRAVWHPCTQMQALQDEPVQCITAAQGPWLYGEHGERWFDGIASWWTCLLGHRVPEVVAAMHAQLDRLDHVMLAGLTHAPAVALAEALVQRSGGALPHVSYASDGASALEIALKQSAHAWLRQGRPGKHQFVCLRHSYHGETLGALGVTDQAIFRTPYAELVHGAWVIDGPQCPLGAGHDRAALAQDAAAFGERLEALLYGHADSIAAVVLEPLLQGAGGMRMFAPDYLRVVRKLCDRYEVHWIADEIATGCGRTGTFFAVEQARVWPDLLCLSKGLSGGMLPLSVCLSSEQVYRCFLGADNQQAFLHSHSFSGNPLACAAALATLEVLDTQQVMRSNVERAAHIAQGLSPLLQHDGITGLRQLGMVWAFEVQGGRAQARAIQRSAWERGLMIRPLGATVYLVPPFLLSTAECAWLAETLVESVTVAAGKVPPVASAPDELQPIA